MRPLLFLSAIIIALLACTVEAGPYNCGPNGCGPAYGRAPVARAAGRIRSARPVRRLLSVPFRFARRVFARRGIQ